MPPDLRSDTRRVSMGGGGGAQRARAPPPLDIDKQKKVIRANFKLFHLYLPLFQSEISFSLLFSELGTPPPCKIEKQKNSLSNFRPPPYEFLDTPLDTDATMLT